MPTPTNAIADRLALAPTLAEGLEGSAAATLQGAPAGEAVTADPSQGLKPAHAPKRTLRDQIRNHPLLAFALGGLAIAGIAAVAGRGTIARTAGPILGRAIRPTLIRAAARRPFNTAKLAARYPQAAARIAAGLRWLG